MEKKRKVEQHETNLEAELSNGCEIHYVYMFRMHCLVSHLPINPIKTFSLP